MLHSIRAVYARQWLLVQGDAAGEAAYHRGLSLLTDIFLDCLVENVEDRMRRGELDRAFLSARLLMAESPARWRALLGRNPQLAKLTTDGTPSR